ncbi:MAG: hypothetical protein Q7T18_05935 [Sedimentisphaerales bacterium]|nr:hypothetical protein [Sedimentisphaerales bacterium]
MGTTYADLEMMQRLSAGLGESIQKIKQQRAQRELMPLVQQVLAQDGGEQELAQLMAGRNVGGVQRPQQQPQDTGAGGFFKRILSAVNPLSGTVTTPFEESLTQSLLKNRMDAGKPRAGKAMTYQNDAGEYRYGLVNPFTGEVMQDLRHATEEDLRAANIEGKQAGTKKTITETAEIAPNAQAGRDLKAAQTNKANSGTRQLKPMLGEDGKQHLVSIDMLTNDPVDNVDMGIVLGTHKNGIVIKREVDGVARNIWVDPQSGDERDLGKAGTTAKKAGSVIPAETLRKMTGGLNSDKVTDVQKQNDIMQLESNGYTVTKRRNDGGWFGRAFDEYEVTPGTQSAGGEMPQSAISTATSQGVSPQGVTKSGMKYTIER